MTPSPGGGEQRPLVVQSLLNMITTPVEKYATQKHTTEVLIN